ncbi:IS1634 family transposase [Turicimonas muris]|uniref:IS1634 family transposase n=3 Tax=Turicimonas muris TaxID=1796652 RepID=UPI00080F0630|nr:transposase [Turicimonas muris]QQQ97177.1 transposase [Turicimonas muris]
MPSLSNQEVQAVLSKTYPLNAGAAYVLKELAIQSGLMRDLKAIFPHNWAEILSLAMFFVIYPDQNLANYDVTAAHCDFPSPPLSSQRISELLASITFKQREQYMKLRLACSTKANSSNYLAFDTTSISSFSQTLNKVAFGHNKEDPEMVMLKIALLIDEITGEPLYYKVLDGSIADVTLLRNLFAELSKLDAEQINLVLDRGFCSENNFQMMFRNNIGFAAGLKSDLKIAQQALQEFVPQLTLALPQQHYPEIDCYCATKKIEWYSSSRTFGKEYSPFYIHVYYDLQRETSEKTHMTALVESFRLRLEKGNVPNSLVFKEFFKLKPSAKKQDPAAEKYQFDVNSWVKFTKSCGFFVLGSNEISSAPQALNIYRQKDVVEKAFNNYKDKCGGRRMRCQETSLDGKVFIIYLSLCLRLILQRRLEQAKKNPLDTPRIIDELNSIVLFRHDVEGKVRHYWQEWPKRYRELLEELGVETPAPLVL